MPAAPHLACQRPSPHLLGSYCMFPVKEDRIWNEYKKAEVTFWTAEDVDLGKDPADWQNKLEQEERSFVASVLGYLAASDQLIQHNSCARFMTDVELPEARAFYSFQLFKQNVHTEMVSSIFAALFAGRAEEVQALFRSIKALPAMQHKVDWVEQWVVSGASFAERLVAFAAVSSVFNAGSFAGLYWFKKRGLLPGCGHATDLLSRDESINVEAAGVMYSLLRCRLSDERAQGIVREAVDIECRFVCDQLPLGAIGLGAAAMEQYLQYVGDRLLEVLGHPPAYGAKASPFGWLEGIAKKAADIKVNTAHNNTSGMSKAGALKMSVGGQQGDALAFDDDF